jgi:hypothetical protein
MLFYTAIYGLCEFWPDVFEVSSLYDRKRVFFPGFNTDLSARLLEYLEGSERATFKASAS